MAFNSYSVSDAVINSGKPIVVNKLAATLLAKLRPLRVKTGTPDHKESMVVVWPL